MRYIVDILEYGEGDDAFSGPDIPDGIAWSSLAIDWNERKMTIDTSEPISGLEPIDPD